MAMVNNSFTSTPHVAPLLVAVAGLALVAWLIWIPIYNLFFHPLADYPGPLLCRATRIPMDLAIFNGNLGKKSTELHLKYGEVVRIAPNELSFANDQVIRDVWTHVPGRPEFEKHISRRSLTPKGIYNILSADKEDHARYRRLLAHAFSAKGMQEQAPLINRHVDLFVERLGEFATSGKEADLVQWFTAVTFDIVGDLAWGESFYCLENRNLHPWVEAIAGNLKWIFQSFALKNWGLGRFTSYITSPELKKLRAINFSFAAEKVENRMQCTEPRGDFWDRVVIKSNNDNEKGTGMTRDEMEVNAAVLALAGSETTATALSAATFLLLSNPDKLENVVKEVRSSFTSGDEITLFNVHDLQYMDAVLEETLRFFPPVPAPAARTTPRGGAMVCGKWLPEGTVINQSPGAAGRLPSNWTRPNEFLPERFLPSAKEDSGSEFARDNRASHTPFSAGTRNCIGMNLAYAEMRLLLAKVLWSYDLSMDVGKVGDWTDTKMWGAVWKEPLPVSVRAAVH